MRSSPSPVSVSRSLTGTVVCLLLASALNALAWETVLESETIATGLVTGELWSRAVLALGGTLEPTPQRETLANVGLSRLFLLNLALAALAWTSGAVWIARRRNWTWQQAAAVWGRLGALWAMLFGAWEILRLATFLVGLTSLETLLLASLPFWVSVAAAGGLATLFTLAAPSSSPSGGALPSVDSKPVPLALLLAAGLYALVFTAMNWQLYWSLLIPHGDSAMYEEHLWNLTHGNGFRSYLDQGLFLGEHIQIIHLLLIPLHLVWPSHLLLELCESLVLASGAIPVYWLARRHSGLGRAAVLLACVYLLYFPLQFLDISIDLKTFRPMSLGMPALLFALDQYERGRYVRLLLRVMLALSAKEDFSIVLAPLGVWIFAKQVLVMRGTAKAEEQPLVESQSAERGPRTAGDRPATRKGDFRLLGLGAGLAVFGVVYLWLAVRVVIPWFRGGEDVHYARYFSKFGESMGEIVWTMLTNPVLLAGELLTVQTALYALALLAPLGFLPLFSPGRLAVALPLFVILCLNEIAQDPRHHFHAPLVPIVFWAAAAGLKNVTASWEEIERRWLRRQAEELRPATDSPSLFMARFACAAAVATGLFFSMSPLSISFWDPASNWHWRKLYVPGKRAKLFPKVFEQIPKDSRVASTDFIHPRFTHHDRSYDYSHYRRKVSGDEELRAPRDTDYIVIDTQHPYSDIKTPDQIWEYREQPDQWELLPDVTGGYFIVLKRVRD